MESPLSRPAVAVLAVLAGITLAAVTVKVGSSTVRDVREIRNAPAMSYITVEGKGKVMGKPDIGKIQLTVVSEGATPTDATGDGTKKYDALLAAVKGLGVTADDLKTTNYSLYPRYRWEQETGKQLIDAYELRQSLEVKVRNLSNMGKVISAATDSGANQIDGLSLDIDNREALLADARKQGIAEAKAKAGVLAASLGVELGEITSYNEYSDSGMQPPMYYGRAAEGIGGGGDIPSVETGSQEVTLNVSITYSMED